MPSVALNILSALHVPHTAAYTGQRFASMPFQTLFGFSKLLGQYGVETQGVHLADKSQVASLPLPFVSVATNGAWGVVTDINTASDTVTIIPDGDPTLTVPTQEFTDNWTGTALLCSARKGAHEPAYASHVISDTAARLAGYALVAALLVLVAASIWINGLWQKPALLGVLAADCIGFTAAVFLMQKTVGIHTKAASAVCASVDPKGCDTVIKTGGTFLGVFHWSEVGFAYFSVSILALLIWPQTAAALAVINLCCLPYTVWSISYQHFKVHRWCALCLTVQATLWLLALCYTLSGWWHNAQSNMWLHLVLLAAGYVLVFTATNKSAAFLSRIIKKDNA